MEASARSINLVLVSLAESFNVLIPFLFFSRVDRQANDCSEDFRRESSARLE